MKWPRFRKKQRRIPLAPGQSHVVKREAGDAVISEGKDGKARISLDRIEAVGIYHLAHVLDYSIVRAVGMESHSVTFKNGAILSFAYGAGGRLVELSADGLIELELDAKGALIFGIPKTPATGP